MRLKTEEADTNVKSLFLERELETQVWWNFSAVT